MDLVVGSKKVFQSRDGGVAGLAHLSNASSVRASRHCSPLAFSSVILHVLFATILRSIIRVLDSSMHKSTNTATCNRHGKVSDEGHQSRHFVMHVPKMYRRPARRSSGKERA
jgi:hypothetical protein